MNANLEKAETRSGPRALTTEEMAAVSGGMMGLANGTAGAITSLIDWLRSLGNTPSNPVQPPSGSDRPKHVGRGCNVADWY